MPILLFVLLFSACLGGDLDSRIDETQQIATPVPTPTGANQKKECVSSCKEACKAWGEWSELSPAADTVCSNKKLTQSQERKRTCVGTCPDVTCQDSETKEIEVSGTKDCSNSNETPLPCHTSCTTGCQAKKYGDWLPKQDSKYTCEEFTQTRDWTRQCFPTCDDKADCLCTGTTCAKTGSESKPDDVKGTKVIDCNQACDNDAGDITWGNWTPQLDTANICQGQSKEQKRKGTFTCPRDTCKQCPTETTDKRDLGGTKVTDCQADNSPYCDAWQPAYADCVWTPAIDLSTKYDDEEFPQTCKQTRECPRACKDSECKLEKKRERKVWGTKKRVAKVTSEPPEPVTPKSDPPKSDPPKSDPPDPPAPTCNASCSDGCAAWSGWAWSSSDSCPSSSDYFGAQQEPKEIEETRNRTRKCENNLCTGVECFTSNTETRTTPCAFCTGANQKIEADGTCGCDRSEEQIKYYRVGNKCEACEKPNTLEESNGTYTCSAPPACTPTAWEVQGVHIGVLKVCDKLDTACQQTIAGGICKGLTVTPMLSFIRQCNDCTAAECSPTKPKEPAEQTIAGTKVTPCNTFCTWEDNWGNWTATETCPAGSDKSLTRHTIQGKEKKKLISCTAALCPNSGCTDLTRAAQRYCSYCDGEGMQKVNKDTASEKCVCKSNTIDRYYKDGDGCTHCPLSKDFKQVDGVWGCHDKPAPTEPPETEEASAESCADFCDEKWTGWSGWEIAKDAQGNDTFKCPNTATLVKPKEAQQVEEQSRSRTCTNAPAELGCFTSNTETRVTKCDYCSGEGMKKENEGTTSETCVCKDNYYEKDGVCEQCGVGEILNASKDGCICDAGNSFYLQDGSCVKCEGDNRELVDGSCDCKDNYYEKDGECVQCGEGKILNASKDGCICEGDNRKLVGGSCDCKDGYEEVNGECQEETITCDPPKILVNGECKECDSDAGYVPNANGDGCICNTSSGYYDYMGSCVLCNQANKKLVSGKCVCDSSKGYVADGSGCKCDATRNLYQKNGSCVECDGANRELVNGNCDCKDGYEEVNDECQEEAAAAQAPEPELPSKANNCKDGCEAWSGWAWSTPSGGASCPSSSAFNPPPANTDKKRTRSRTCPNLAAGVDCLTVNTEVKRCWWCQGDGQIFNDTGDCVCDVAQGWYRDTSAKPQNCKQCVAGKIPNATGNSCVCAETECSANLKKEWDNIKCECGACKEDIVAACSYGYNDDDCTCKSAPPPPVVPVEPEKITITIYHGCFYSNNTVPLYMPQEDSLLGKNHEWKETCLGDDYEDDASTLHNATEASGAVTNIIQKLYDCANGSTKESQKDFVDSATQDSLCEFSTASSYEIQITP